MTKHKENTIHLIAFDIPYPANYGGVVDILYKLKALKKNGVSVILHAYQYGREQQDILKKYCHTIYYYKRKTYRNLFYGKLPYIIASRNSSALIENLTKDEFPILFEGLHCCYYLDNEKLKNRMKIVRMHNIEHHYYKHLELAEKNIFKRYFFKTESEKLKEFESSLSHADLLACISPADTVYYQKLFPEKAIYLPAFHPNDEILSLTGKGKYVFYHGNLQVAENKKAALFLCKEVFSKLPEYKLIIAGSNPDNELRKWQSELPNITLLDKLDTKEMLDYISNAHINILYTDQATGIKLKLINSLFRGRFCIANDYMINDTGLEDLCIRKNTPKEFIDAIKEVWKKPFTQQMIDERKDALEIFDNNENGDFLKDLLVGNMMKA